MVSGTLDSLAEQVRKRRELPSGEELKRIRRAARVSRRELAAAVGVSESTILAYEQGRFRPRGANLDRYLAAIQVLREAD